MEQKEKDAIKNEIALFRYGLIAPVITNTFEENSQLEYFKKVASKKYIVNGHEERYSWQTIKNWYLQYKKEGYDGLINKTRSDCHSSRKLKDDVIQRIKELKKEYPHISGTLIYNKLSDEGFINPNDICLGTILKFIRDNKILFNETEGIDRRAFVMEHANDCWQADTSHGPYLTINGKKTLTYLIAIIDDASRLIVGAKFYFNDNSINLQDIFKSSVKKYGVPKKLFVDNGKTYKNDQFNIICASLGLVLIHARPYSGASKGKIERFFHTMKETWMRGLNWNEIKSIDELNDLLNDFIANYNNSVHSSLKNELDENITPNSRWFKDSHLIKKLDNNFIDIAFLHTAYPTIRSDAIANIKTHEFEVPMKYIGKKITVKFNPLNYDIAWIYENNKLIENIHLVNKIDNSKIKRKKTLY